MAEDCADTNIFETENFPCVEEANSAMTKGITETAIYLTSCAVNGTKPEEGRLSGVDFGELFSFASYHMMSAVVAMGLEAAGIMDTNVKRHIAYSVRKNTYLETASREVQNKFEEAGIWYMPLKGSVLKEYYPRFGMREMSDQDILIDETRAWDVKRIMGSLSFTTEYYGQGSHDVYYREPLCNFEIHRELFGSTFDEKIHEYYADVKSLLIKDTGNKYGYHFSPEDFYVYITAHEYKHYSGSGTGLRSLLDVYVFLKNFGEILDCDYVKSEVAKLGISEFEEQNRSLAENLFGGYELTEENREMLEYVVQSGAYGTVENSIKNKLATYGRDWKGKIKYLATRVFPNSQDMKNTYPLLCGHKILYPALVCYRLLRALVKRRRETLREICILWQIKS